jgi:hypothetical protein
MTAFLDAGQDRLEEPERFFDMLQHVNQRDKIELAVVAAGLLGDDIGLWKERLRLVDRKRIDVISGGLETRVAEDFDENSDVTANIGMADRFLGVDVKRLTLERGGAREVLNLHVD